MSTATDIHAIEISNPNAELRHPTTVLICLLPLSILGELYRWIILKKHALLADDVWLEIGHVTGIISPMIPSILLIIGCVAWMFISKKKWTFPDLSIIARVIGWAVLWCLVRTVISFTNEGLHPDSVKMLGTIGLCVSAATQEEIIFRAIGIGVIAWIVSLAGLPLRWGLWILLPITALLFSLAHTHVMNSNITPELWNPAQVVEQTIAGLIYGYVFIRQGLAVSTLTHFFFNMLMVTGSLSAF